MKHWSDDEEAGGDMDELDGVVARDLAEIVAMMLEDDPNDPDCMPKKLKNKAAKRKEKAKGEL